MKYTIPSLFVALFLLAPTAFVSAQGDVDPLGDKAMRCLNLSTDLRVTSTGTQVSDLQFFLQLKGYLNSEPTGYFGLMTYAAVQKYQNAYGITPASGFVGPLTRASINSVSCGTSTYTPKKTEVKVTTKEKKKVVKQLPNLIVKNVEYERDVMDGGIYAPSQMLTVTVYNDGNGPSDIVGDELKYKVTLYEETEDGDTVNHGTSASGVFEIPAAYSYGEFQVSIEGGMPFDEDDGDRERQYRAQVHIDPNNNLKESNEKDNKKSSDTWEIQHYKG